MERQAAPAEWECQDEKGSTPVSILGQTKLSSIE